MSGINKLSFVYLRYERTVFVIAVVFTFFFALCQHHAASSTLQQHGEWPLGPLYKNLVPWSHSLDGHDSMDIPPAKAELSPCQLSLLMTQSTVSASVLLFYKAVLAKFQPLSFAIFFPASVQLESWKIGQQSIQNNEQNPNSYHNNMFLSETSATTPTRCAWQRESISSNGKCLNSISIFNFSTATTFPVLQ